LYGIAPVQNSPALPYSQEGVFVGRCITQNAFQIYIPCIKKILISKDIKVDETMVYHVMKKRSHTLMSPFFRNWTSTKLPQISIFLEKFEGHSRMQYKWAKIINNEAIDKEIHHDESPNAINAKPCVDTDLQFNNERTRQLAGRLKISDRYLQYRKSIAKQKINTHTDTKNISYNFISNPLWRTCKNVQSKQEASTTNA
jgi:hypothetical protein